MVARDSTRITDLRTATPCLGTDGTAMVYPFRGRFKALTQLSAIFHDMNLKVRLWVILLWICAVAVLVDLSGRAHGLPPWWVLFGLGVIAALAERQGVFITGNIETSVSFLPTVFTAVAFGPLAAAVVSAAASHKANVQM